ncbi:MAG: pyridoxal phosphate-dependent aminotransferase family protein [Bacteroidetes bacterium]|nr:pyridoxal phosphate-dependent aminotransferase family protein [Bacteroidota bacterium]
MVSHTLHQKMKKFTIPAELKQAGIYPYFRPIEENHDTEVTIGGRRVLMFGSNSYMGLTNHPKVKEAASKALERYGSSCSGSRFLNGTSKLHIQLEEKLAEFVGKEAALVFSTGYQTNLGVVATLTGRHGVLLLDELDHASIIEGSRLSFSRVLKFAHNDMNELENQLRSIDDDRIRMIVVDGIFSMEGDVADLPSIVKLANKYGAALMVDDAHALGVLGKQGEGTAAHFGLTNEVDLIMSTFSKSLASLGGFVASNKDIINYLKHNARSMIFSASIPPSAAAAALAALEIIKSEPDRLEQLWENTRYATETLKSLGFDIGKTETPIIPIYIRDDMTTFKFTNRLFEEGVFVNPVVSPAVKSDSSLIRMSLMATHSIQQIEQAIDKINKVAKELGVFALQEMIANGTNHR